MSEELSKTLQDNDMNRIFTEVTHSESLGLPGPEQLRLFHLLIRDKQFYKDDVESWLYWNIGNYVFSRAKLEQFRDDGHLIGVIDRALHTMKRNGATDIKGAGNELGEILVYAFLEGKLDAPKLMSRVELSTDLSQYNSVAESIHLLTDRDKNGRPYNQMVFGASNIVGDLQDAIDSAFDTILQIKSHTSSEIQMVEKTVFERSFDKTEANYLKDVLLPQPNGSNSYDTAYGIFLGYSLGIEWARHKDEDYVQVVTQKMVHDIQKNAPYIAEKIRTNGLEMHSFYVYIVPFDDAEADKNSIMNHVMEGEVGI